VSFEGYTDEEIKRWLWLRAIEWSAFPAYVSQVVAPILFIFHPWYLVILALVAFGLFWCVIRYAFVSVTLSNTACLVVVWLKWPVATGSAIYLFVHHEFAAGAAALIWPLVAAFTIPPGKVGVIELALAKRIGFVPPDASL
jgi:hypothetical protein